MLPTPRRLMALVACWIVLLAAEHCDAGFAIADLGALGDSPSSGIAGINAQGAVAGTAYGADGPFAVASSPSGVLQRIDLRGLPAGASYANGIGDGGVVVGTYYNTADRTYHAFRYADGKATDLGTPAPGPAGRVDTYGVAVNATGVVAGTVYQASGTPSPFRTQGVTTTIALPGGSTIGRASGINNAGAVVGSYMDARGTWRVFTAAPDEAAAVDPLRNLATPGFGSNMYGVAINSRGEVAGFGDINGQKHAFFVSGANFYDIKPTAGYTSTRATALDDSGLVVGQMDGTGPLSHAFVWVPPSSPGLPPGGTLDLNSLLSDADRRAWTLTAATGINARGQISGQGYYNGVLHGFVLDTPGGWLAAPATVPAPPSAVLVPGGLAVAAGVCRLRRGRIVGRGTA